jgi:hypothetical protein
MSLTSPRYCIRCQAVKSADGFPPEGRERRTRPRKTGRTGMSRVCWLCVEERAYAIEARGFQSRGRTWTDEQGKRWRRCGDCGRKLRLIGRNFHVAHKREGRKRLQYARECRRCRKVRNTNGRRVRARDPKWRKRVADHQRQRLNSDPELRQKAREAAKRWKDKLKATDPEGYARQLELTRINYRLKREREGKRVRPSASLPKKAKRVTSVKWAPVEPLVAVLEGVVQQRRKVARELTGDFSEATINALCRELRLPDRTWRLWREGGGTTRVGHAEELLLKLDIAFEAVYSRDDHPELYLERAPA